MRTIVVYEFDGKCYIAVAGDASSFKTKEEILCTGAEKEIFSVSRPEHEPFLVLLKEAIAEIDKREITDIQFMEDILMGRKLYAAIPRGPVN